MFPAPSPIRGHQTSAASTRHAENSEGKEKKNKKSKKKKKKKKERAGEEGGRGRGGTRRRTAPVVVEVAQERDELVPVLLQDVEDGLLFVRVRDEHLEHVERLELDVAALVAQQVHHQLEVVGGRDVPRHHAEVGPVQQRLAEELRCFVQVCRVQERGVLLEELFLFPPVVNRVTKPDPPPAGPPKFPEAARALPFPPPRGGPPHVIILLVQVIRNHRLVSRQDVFEARKRVRRDVEGGHLHVVEEPFRFVSRRRNAGRVPPRVLVPIPHHSRDHFTLRPTALRSPSQERERHPGVIAQVVDGREPRADLPSQKVVEDLGDVFLCLELELRDVLHQQLQQIVVVHFLGQLGDLLRIRFLIFSPKREDLLHFRQRFRYLVARLPENGFAAERERG
ncbi:MAG: hypothetical protein BJ554DRAFT_7492 [Olpidium bornovanus]|uniref:Uncharacterized protein n=1 Tax=Olpidium bornovanus TaxID=278681 RepID=A0A8H7ZW19_9FUNG|nr:MAG: hypothetical protein BJ554DRAFT_7492 [Olpidium bornovanus]